MLESLLAVGRRDFPKGQMIFTTTGSTSWVVPEGVTEISAVCVGGGGGGGSYQYITTSSGPNTVYTDTRPGTSSGWVWSITNRRWESTNKTDPSTSTMTVTVSLLAGQVFSWVGGVSSEPSYDKLSFRIDGVEQQVWSGIQSNVTRSFTATSSKSYTFSWVYSKDGSQSKNGDLAWVSSITAPSIITNTYTRGGSGGGGGGLGWAEKIPVTPGETLTILVGAGGTGTLSGNNTGGAGGLSEIRRASQTIIRASGGSGGSSSNGGSGGGRTISNTLTEGPTGGGNGLNGSLLTSTLIGGGGGAAGYNNGIGGGSSGNQVNSGGAGSKGYYGGGVGVLGQGLTGSSTSTNGKPGSGGSGQSYGGGGGGGQNGASGAVRIIWGEDRFYPSTGTLDV